MIVELDVARARRTRAGSWEFRRLQAALDETSAVVRELPELGYRGFRYADASGSVRAYWGQVRCARAILADPSFSVERFLLRSLPAGFAEFRAVAGKELR